MNLEPTCAVCGRTVPPDMDHVRLDAETVRTDDRNDVDDYVFHTRCWYGVAGSWRKPA